MTDDERRHRNAGRPTIWPGYKGMDLVRRTLEEARGAARSQGKDVGRGRASRRRAAWPAPAVGAGRGPGPDSRDPQLLGSATRDVARNRGWSARVAEGAVFGRWQAVVGEQIAAHADADRAERGRADGVRRIDGVGDAVADGSGATARQDRRGGRATVW